MGFCLAAMWLGGPPSAHAIIKVKFPVSRVYKEASVVAIGEIDRFTSGRTAVDCKVTEPLKGTVGGEDLQVTMPAEMVPQLRAGQPAVIFTGASGAILHVADKWLQAERVVAGRETAWRVTGPYDLVQDYPGRTIGLVQIVKELKAGKPGIQDWISHEAFLGGVRDRGNLGVKPAFLLAVELNEDQNLDLVVGAADGVRVFHADAQGYADATAAWGLAGTSARHGASGDVNGDGQPDLLLDDHLWTRAGNRFVKLGARLNLPKPDTWAAVALADVTGDRRAEILVLQKTGELTVCANPAPAEAAWKSSVRKLWQTGEPALAAAFSAAWGDDGEWHVMVVHPAEIIRYPVGPKGAPRADFERLTGLPFPAYRDIGAKPLQVDLCTVVDYDGNGRPDLMLVTQGGGVTLANRGFGAFLVNKYIHEQFRWKSPVKLPKLPFELTPGTVVAPGKTVLLGKRYRQNLLVLRSDGQLFEMDNKR